MNYKLLLIFGLPLYFLLFALSVSAQSTGLGIQPVKISHTLNPGESVSGTIRLTNESDERVKLEVKVEDFIPLAGAEGISFVGRADGITTVRDWFVVSGDQNFVFEKGETRNIAYNIIAPPEAEPGGHFGVVFFKATQLEESGQLKIGAQVGVLVFVTVPGKRLEQGRLLEFSGPRFVQKGPIIFKTKFENTGTVHFVPQGAIHISNLFGREVGQTPLNGVVVLPTGVKEQNIAWAPTGFLLGRYLAEAKVLDNQGEVINQASWFFYAVPVWYFIGFLAAVILLFFIIRFIKRRVRFSISLTK